MSNILSWDIKEIEDDLNKRLLTHFKGERSNYVQVGPNKFLFPKKFAEEAAGFYNFKPRSTDSWVITFPRSGTTWTQEMVWLLQNNLDYNTAAKIPLPTRFPFLEFSACVNSQIKDEWLHGFNGNQKKQDILEEVSRSAVETLTEMKEPRFIKTHLPISLLSPELLQSGAKIIYVARNPKDVAVSFYHLHRLIKTLDFVGDFQQFWEYFEADLVMWSPYWTHLNEAWQLRDHPNLLFLFYEDMKKDVKGSINKISEFLKVRYDEEQIEGLAQHLDISNFRENSSVNCEGLSAVGMLNEYGHRYVRRGEAGGWKEMFTTEFNERADRWISKHLDKTDLRFPISVITH